MLREIADRGGVADTYADFPNEVPDSIKGRQLTQGGGFFSVGPHQFYGLEINKRAVPIAELVLWIGFLKWQIRTTGLANIKDPVLDNYGTIKEQDAILAYERREVMKDENGLPLSRWDGVTKKLHPITGEEVPDASATVEIYKYINPRRAQWPEAEFIVGNPPFIGNKRMIQRLGEGYVSVMRLAYGEVPDSVDFVMYWWWLASKAVSSSSTRRFGLVTTNKITQSFNSRVVERFLYHETPGSLVFAVPDHPWTDEETEADVRVSMTVGCNRQMKGTVKRLKVTHAEEPLPFETLDGHIGVKSFGARFSGHSSQTQVNRWNRSPRSYSSR